MTQGKAHGIEHGLGLVARAQGMVIGCVVVTTGVMGRRARALMMWTHSTTTWTHWQGRQSRGCTGLSEGLRGHGLC